MSLWWLSGKESACNVGDPGSNPGSGRSHGEGNSLPTQVFLPGASHGQRSLAGYNRWGCKESGTTKQLILSHMSIVSVQFRHSVMSNTLQPHGLQHARTPCPSPTSRACSNSCLPRGDAIQPSHPLLPPSPPAFNLSQHQGLFQ